SGASPTAAGAATSPCDSWPSGPRRRPHERHHPAPGRQAGPLPRDRLLDTGPLRPACRRGAALLVRRTPPGPALRRGLRLRAPRGPLDGLPRRRFAPHGGALALADDTSPGGGAPWPSV